MKNPTVYFNRDGQPVPLTKGNIRRFRKDEHNLHKLGHTNARLNFPFNVETINRMFPYRPPITGNILPPTPETSEVANTGELPGDIPAPIKPKTKKATPKKPTTSKDTKKPAAKKPAKKEKAAVS